MNNYVFVYGTLKKGMRNNFVLRSSPFIQKGRTKPSYRMYCNGRYPCLKEDKKNGYSVQGEVYQVSKEVETDLNILEGIPYLYTKKRIKLDNFNKLVYVYIYNGDVDHYRKAGRNWKPPVVSSLEYAIV